jgi:hypothetical protein
MTDTYKIIRFYRPDLDRDNEVIASGVSYETAKAWCNDEGTHTAEWFDGYQSESRPPEYESEADK